MPDLSVILDWLASQLPLAKDIMAWIGTLIVAATGIVKLTPSQKDDEFLEKVLERSMVSKFLSAIEKFSVIKRK